MPHTAKKSKISKKTKAANRLRKSKQRKREKDEFSKLVYLQSQLDQYGNPLDLMNTDEELLNDEQKFVTRVIRKLNELDKTSLANFLNNIYDEDSIDKLVKHYYATKENRSWSDALFQITYNCLGVLNLNHLLTYKISEYLENVLDDDSEHSGQEVTKDSLVNLFSECVVGLNKTKIISLSEIINTCLLIYAQTTYTCIIEDDEMYGGNGRNNLSEFFLTIAVLIATLGLGYMLHYMTGLTFEDFYQGFFEVLFSN